MGVALTPRMSWATPTEETDPWFDILVSLFTAQDGDAFAAREDRNLILASNADFTWTAAGGALTWDDDIVLVHPHTGKVAALAAGSVNIPTNGQLFTVNVTRAATNNYALTQTVLSRLNNTPDEVVLAVRYSDVLFWRNGSIFLDGHSGGLGGGGGTSLSADIVDALNGAAAPSAANVFATIADLGAIGSGLLRETLTAQVTGANTTYTTAVPYVAGSLRVYRNGVHQQQSGDGFFVETSPGTGVFDTVPTYGLGERCYVEYTP